MRVKYCCRSSARIQRNTTAEGCSVTPLGRDPCYVTLATMTPHGLGGYPPLPMLSSCSACPTTRRVPWTGWPTTASGIPWKVSAPYLSLSPYTTVPYADSNFKQVDLCNANCLHKTVQLVKEQTCNSCGKNMPMTQLKYNLAGLYI